MTRRGFGTLLAGGALTRSAKSATVSIDDKLRAALAKNRIPAAVAMVASEKKVLYQGAFGVKADAIFRVASMTKPVTTTAALQLVEQGKLKLEDPVEQHLPALGGLEVLDGFDADGKPVLRPMVGKITLHHLLTHTSGITHPVWDPLLARYQKAHPADPARPLLRFDPGKRWHYGSGVDWAGRLVEQVSGLTLEEYVRKYIAVPLVMPDTSFILEPSKFDRLAPLHRIQSDGGFRPLEGPPPQRPKSFNGGSGLYSTAPDYIRFLGMVLRAGRSQGSDRLLRPQTAALMTKNQIGDLEVTELKSSDPATSADLILHPGGFDKFTLGFLLNQDGYQARRFANSLTWAGAANTYFWINPRANLCAVLMMHFQPFLHPSAVDTLREFEYVVYAAGLADEHAFRI